LDELDTAADRWIEQDTDAEHQLANESTLDVDDFGRTLQRIDTTQVSFFDALEGFLAAWSRLSLLFFPNRGDRDTETFRQERGAALRSQLGVEESSRLADRELRNSWMHFDERMDYMLANGRRFDRQRFVTSRQVSDFVGSVARLMVIDARIVYYLTRDGETDAVRLSELRSVVDALKGRVEEWWKREPSRHSTLLTVSF
jgi:hypothetical protein